MSNNIYAQGDNVNRSKKKEKSKLLMFIIKGKVNPTMYFIRNMA